jgi:hypothetical protein
MFSQEDVFRISRELGEPKWLLEERIKALRIFNVMGGKEAFPPALWIESKPAAERKATARETSGVLPLTLHEMLFDKTRAPLAKTIFINRYFKPVNSMESAFINAFFMECNFFLAEAKPEKGGNAGRVALNRSGGVSMNFFLLPKDFRLRLDVVSSGPKGGANTYEAYLAEGSLLECSALHEAGGEISLSAAVLGKKAACRSGAAILSSGKMHNAALLFADGGEYRESSAVSLAGYEKADISSYALHQGQGALSNINIRGAVRDSAELRLGGLARILNGAKKSDSHISEHALILNQGARASANPELEILDNDVKAGHSASSGGLDEEKLFYLMSRGLSEQNAKAALVEGFLTGAMAGMPELLTERLRDSISRLYKSYPTQ